MSPEARYKIECLKDKTPTTNFFLWIMIGGIAIACMTGGHTYV